MFTNRLRPVAYIVIGVLTLALAQSANGQGCRGGGGGGGGMGGGGMMGGGYPGGGFMGGMGQSPGMMGGNSFGGNMGGMGQQFGGMMGGGYMGQSSGMTGGYWGQRQNGMGSLNYSGPQQAMTSSSNVSLNNPSTVLAHTADLNLTGKQVQVLEKMVNSGKQRAALVLTQPQRKQLAQIIGIVPKS